MAQPTIDHPNNKFNTKIDATCLWCRFTATRYGKKYIIAKTIKHIRIKISIDILI